MSVLAEKLVLWFQVNFDPPLNDRGVLKVEDWAEICRLHRAEGMAIRAIARRLEISRNAVKKAVTSHEPPRYVRAGAGSAVDGFEPQVRALLAEFPEMPTSVIMERVGWARGSADEGADCGDHRSALDGLPWRTPPRGPVPRAARAAWRQRRT
jgi:hypothetical protein